MKILICGASGFVGRNLCAALRAGGHTVTRALRRPEYADDIHVDFCRDTANTVWLPRVQGYDAVINAVGVLRDSKRNPMQQLHSDTPRALFSACATVGVARLVHISALGVDSGLRVPYFTTRLAAEAALAELADPLRTLCLRPSVIYGADGASAKMFRFMASLPLQCLPLGGVQSLQPVHIDDICMAIRNWLEQPDASTQLLAAVGADATTMRGMLDSYRAQLGHGPALHIPLPATWTRLVARLGDFFPAAPLCSDTYAMLAIGNTADPANFATLLGRPPRSFAGFI